MFNEKYLEDLRSWQTAESELVAAFRKSVKGWPDNGEDASPCACVDAWLFFAEGWDAAWIRASEYIANQLAPVNGALLDMRNARIRGNYGQ